MENEYLAIEKFLLDIECLEVLNRWTKKQNIFDILKISDAEIRHSNFLAWLLDANESHGFSDAIIRKLVTNLISNNREIYDGKIDISEVVLMEYDSFMVLREWKNIDLLIISDELKFLIAFENKIWSKESTHQLKKYKDILEAHYPDYKKIQVYLTPQGDESSDVENWVSLDYSVVTDAIEKTLEKHESVNSDVKMLVRHYIESVRRNVVGDQELVKVCERIYRKHKVALDLIFDNRPDNLYNISELIKNTLIERQNTNGDIEFFHDLITKTYLKFTTPIIDELIPADAEKSGGWGNGHSVFFEVENRENVVKLKIGVANVDTERAEKLIKIGQEIIGKPALRDGWKWKTLINWEVIKMNGKDYNGMDDDERTNFEKDLKNKLNKTIDKALEFEKKIKEKW